MNETGFTGVGIRVTRPNPDEPPYVTEVFRDSPAAGAGVKPGDQLMAVDGASTSGRGLTEVVNTIRGAQGTRVVLSVVRGGQPPVDIRITRGAGQRPARRGRGARRRARRPADPQLRRRRPGAGPAVLDPGQEPWRPGLDHRSPRQPGRLAGGDGPRRHQLHRVTSCRRRGGPQRPEGADRGARPAGHPALPVRRDRGPRDLVGGRAAGRRDQGVPDRADRRHADGRQRRAGGAAAALRRLGDPDHDPPAGCAVRRADRQAGRPAGLRGEPDRRRSPARRRSAAPAGARDADGHPGPGHPLSR